jgi:mRNA interferase MazF
MPYVPAQGDIIFLDFSPQAGHEQAGRRPAVVVSNNSFFEYTHAAIVCPVTNTNNKFPLHVALDDRTTTTGVILCEHCKSLDIIARNAVFAESLPKDKLEEVKRNIRLFF